MAEFCVILATSNDGGIGKNNRLPWPRLAEDFRNFRKVTKELNSSGSGTPVVIMGRKTWESLPVRPLPDRYNIIVSKKMPHADGTYWVASSLRKALNRAYRVSGGAQVSVIGGAGLFEEAMFCADCAAIHHTLVHEEYETDVCVRTLGAALMNFVEVTKKRYINVGEIPSFTIFKYERKKLE